MNKIGLVSRFISSEDCQFYIDYINNNIDKLYFAPHAKRWQLTLGKDNLPTSTSPDNLDSVADIEDKLRNLFDAVVSEARIFFKDDGPLHVSNIFFAKQSAGAIIPPHHDQDYGSNAQVKYSAVIYLNTMGSQKDGILNFPNVGHSIRPVAGDLALFPSTEQYTHEVASISEDRYALPIFMSSDPEYRL